MNPNGAWTCRAGTRALPSVPAWISGEPAWAPSSVGGNFLPGWLRASSNNIFSLDLNTGDISVHTTDLSNGAANGAANVIWTSPGDGTIDIAGGIWMARKSEGRANNWFLKLDGNSLTDGHVSSFDAFTRANPFDFAAGSGGAAVLQDIPVSAGDVVELELVRTTTFGDFVGMDLVITLTEQPRFYSVSAKTGVDDLVVIESDGSVTVVGSLGADVGAADLAVFDQRLFLLRDGSDGANPQIPTLMEIAPSTGAIFSSENLIGVGSENRAEGLAGTSGHLLVGYSGGSGTSSDTLGELAFDGMITNPTSFSTDFDGLGADAAGNLRSTDQFSSGSSNSRLYAVDFGAQTITTMTTISSVGLNDLAFSELGRLFAIDVNVDGFTSARLIREFDPGSGTEIASASYDSNLRLFGLAPVIVSPDTDGDNMDDSWENHFFGDLLRDGIGDFDADGTRDETEFLGATDPVDRRSRFLITDISRSDSAVTITWDSVGGRVYRVQYKDHLNDSIWTNLGDEISATAASTSANDDSLSDPTTRFYRIIVVP